MFQESQTKVKDACAKFEENISDSGISSNAEASASPTVQPLKILCQKVLDRENGIDDNENDSRDSRTMLGTSLDSHDLQQAEQNKRNQKKRTKLRRTLCGYIRNRRLKRKKKLAAEASSSAPLDETQPAAELDISKQIKTEPNYRKYRNSMLEIITQNEILDSRTRKVRRASQPFMYSQPVPKPKAQSPLIKNPKPLQTVDITAEDANTSVTNETKAKRKVANPFADKPKAQQKVPEKSEPIVRAEKAEKTEKPEPAMYSPQSRTKRRINYSEELIDEAVMYEEMLLNQLQCEKAEKVEKAKAPVKRIEKPKINPFVANVSNIDSRLRILEQRNEISIMPVKSRITSKEAAAVVTAATAPVKAKPLFNITSSVSVHIKSAKTETPTNSKSAILQIATIKSLHNNNQSQTSETPKAKKRKVSCKCCDKAFDDEKKLAVHQMVHLRIPIHQLDSVQILHPKLRRVRVKMRFPSYFPLFLIFLVFSVFFSQLQFVETAVVSLGSYVEYRR